MRVVDRISFRRRWQLQGFACSVLYVLSTESWAQSPRIQTISELRQLSIEELMNIEVTSVSRTVERANDAAAAVHVITEEDIRRSGARSIPEALRLAPNLQVSQSNSRSWAISARGFKASFSNKLLVLIDGRSVYTPLFSGVFWDAQDTLLEDIERIEVISGPGATVWGANAVNGVINIITKSSRDSVGALLNVGGGTQERVLAGLRYGAQASEDLSFRIYGKYFDRASSVFSNGEDASDAWYSGQAGFRLDWDGKRQDSFTLQGDIYDGRGEQLEGGDISQAGGNLLSRWTHRFSETQQLQLQAYYDRTRQFVPEQFGDELDTLDIDSQYEFDLGARQQVVIGGGYRFTRNDIENLPESIAFLPARLDRHLFSVFVQDEISIFKDRVKVTVGSKFEHNDYTGLEVQPSVRFAWSLGSNVVWGAISRAVRTPSRFDRELFFPATPPFIVAGGPGFDSEKLLAYELGWRTQLSQRVLVSVATFINDYDDIRSTSVELPRITQNNVEAQIWGVEVESTWQVTENWRLATGYTLLQEDFDVKAGRADLNAGQGEAFDPQQQLQLRSSLSLPPQVEFDVLLRYVDRVSNAGRGFAVVPDYVALDTRIAWSMGTTLQVAVVGQNLLDKQHPEFGTLEIERSGYLKLTWRF
jgi:iron complex outermembrane recepter protein